MAYLRNSTVTLLNLYYAIHALAMGGGGVSGCVIVESGSDRAPGAGGDVAVNAAGLGLQSGSDKP